MAGVATRLAQWLLPYAVYLRLRARRATAGASALVRSNVALRGLYSGQRAFVLGNGPSVNTQNLRLLKGETVFSVSSGYHHQDYPWVAPRYHCVPSITYGAMTAEDVTRWFREMHERLGDAELFLSESEASLVRQHTLFPGRRVRYLAFGGEFDAGSTRIPDVAAVLPRVQSVTVMALMLALYMGFREIYVLGVEHDQFRTGRYEYFYQPTVLHGKDMFVSGDGKVHSLHDEFAALHTLWSQYRRIRLVAEANGVRIFNATAGGALDEFPRVAYESLFDAPSRASV
jgi:hypothetical protein